jgi:uncharacterized peroxidase-related enzyme
MSWRTWIKIESEDTTNVKVKQLFNKTKNIYTKKISDTVKLTSQTPEVSECLYDLDRAIESAQTNITVREREIAALLVSIMVGCVHCTASHTEKLEKITRTPKLAEQMKKDYRKAELSPRELKIAEFTEKVTKYPNKCKEADIKALRNIGLVDRDILHIVEIIAYYNYSSRLFESLSTIE